jgi:hypothetical protein
MSLRPIATACVLAGLALLLFLFHIGTAPLTRDELAFNAQAQSIRVGQTPLYFHAADDRWLQPVAVYANAGMRAIGASDLAGRLAAAIVAAIGVALTCLIAFEMTGGLWLGVAAGLLLAVTPAYRSFAQLGTDALFPVPLILCWVVNLLQFIKRDSRQSLVTAAAALGLAVYAAPAAPLTAAFLWMLTLVVARRRNRVKLFWATVMFGASWLPAAVWFARHFDTYADTFGRWVIFAAHLRNPLDGVRAFINPGTLGDRASKYWGFWDPSWLFFDGKDSSAPLLMLAAPFIAIGIYRIVSRLNGDQKAIVIGAALIAPLAGATFGVPHFIADASVELPMFALLAALGARQLVAWVSRQDALEDRVVVGAVEGIDVDDALPRS